MQKERQVVIIYPHPDDESFGSAGTIIKMREEGIPVTYLCGTSGNMGRNMGTPPFANRESLAKIREKELDDACKLLDCDLRMLGYHDKTMEFEDKYEVALHLKELIEELDPNLVITYHPLYGVHPDHNAIAAATIEALSMMDKEKRPVMWARPVIREYRDILGTPDVTYDIRDIFDRKMEAIAAHHSQADGILGDMLRKAKISDEVKEEAMQALGVEDYYIWDFQD